MDMKVCFLLFAGGKSTRFGSDKTMLRTGNGLIVESIINKAKESGLFSEYIIASNPFRTAGREEMYCLPGCRELEDTCYGLGPIGGLAACLERCSSETVLSWACDMPFFSSSACRTLLDSFRDHTENDPLCNAVYAENGGLPEPLFGVLDVRAALPKVNELIHSGVNRYMAVYSGLNAKPVPFDAENLFFNINYQKDYERLMTLLGS